MTVDGFLQTRQRLPDFVIAGAPRCGTTWQYHALERHPQIWLAKPVRPEPKFFLVDEEYDQGLDYYAHRWFSNVPEGVMAGEKSTNYMESPLAAERLAQTLPTAKLVFLLREPVSRAFSHFRFTRMNGLEDLDFAEALELEESREEAIETQWRYARPFSYFSKGLYADNLEAWFNLFPRENILIKKYEDIEERPGPLLIEIHRFLGVEPRPNDAGGLGIVNAADLVDADPSVLASLRQRYEAPNERLYELLDTNLWGSQSLAD